MENVGKREEGGHMMILMVAGMATDVIIERLLLLRNYYCTTSSPHIFFRCLTSSFSVHLRPPLSSKSILWTCTARVAYDGRRPFNEG